MRIKLNNDYNEAIKRFCLIVVSLLVNVPAFSQTSNQPLFSRADYPHPVSPSPEAAALGKYGEVPVSFSSGLPEIGIPLYTFNNGDITIPIKLNYHAGGIRVDDIATSVGLGWSLDAGGVITRTVQGSPDGTIPITFPANNFNPNTGNVLAADYLLGKQIVDGSIDLERDIYFYNFAGFSGKFMRTQANKFVFYPANPNIKIETVGVDNISAFTIIDDKGFKYYFNTTEGVKIEPSCTVGIPGSNEYPDGQISAYYLSKIVSPNNNEVDFEYEEYTYKVARNYNEVTYLRQLLSECPELTAQNRVCNDIETFSGRRIKRIKSADDNSKVIVFNYSAGHRADLKYNGIDQGNMLESISIQNAGTTLKNWYMTYNYFGAGTNLRLKLLTVKEDNKPAYEFIYDEIHPLPERLSFSQDYWGYYNGKANYATFIPPIPGIGRASGADRTPDIDYMKSASLTRIKYPTGGYTDFECEAHNGLITEDVTTFATKSVSLSGVANDQVSFHLPAGATELYLSWNLPTINIDDFMNGYILGGSNYSTVFKSVSGAGNQYILPTQSLANLPLDADYRLAIASSNNYDKGDISFSWKEPTTTHQTHNKIVFGGLRVKSIKSYTKDGTLAFVKKYDYNWLDNAKSSVILPASANNYLNFVSYYENPFITTKTGTTDENGNFFPTARLEGTCGYNIISCSSVPSLGMALDNSLCYQQVVETYDMAGANGRTIYNYMIPPVSGAEGILKEKLEQKLESGLYKTIHKQRNSYGVPAAYQDTITNYKVRYISPQYVLGDAAHPMTYPAVFSVEKYFDISAKLQLQKSEDITFNASTTDSLVNTTIYTYGNNTYTYPTIVETTNSQNNVVRTIHQYPQDIVSAGSSPVVYQTMLNRNIISPVVKEIVKNVTHNRVLIEKDVEFKDWGNNIIHPNFVKSAYNGNTNLVNEISYDKYDNKGNVLQIRIKDGSPTVYLWGYNSQYPIAEIKNATYQQVLDVLGQAKIDQSAGSNPGDDASVRKMLEPLRIALPQSLVSTYTYSPLVGMTSMTDAKGETTYYEYDAFQRLKCIKDSKGNIVRQMDYHYQNQ
ncbi:hypothetical protein [Mucilaginibacter lacusdianchii]|uniref:hypothetical protein n=1 Tax=Mucilaginibacter lacusdianchii TaxID=2684211 RepID=UPI00131DE783|nr:hypothetical protein [Mucilaginibacter sp. JXJ CY 39]